MTKTKTVSTVTVNRKSLQKGLKVVIMPMALA